MNDDNFPHDHPGPPTTPVSAEPTYRTANPDTFAIRAGVVFAEQTSSSATNDSSAASPVPSPSHADCWLGTTRAKRLLGVGSENTIRNWVRYGYLRARRLPNGRIQVLQSDVVRLASQPPAP
jgi:hypothetical protein